MNTQPTPSSGCLHPLVSAIERLLTFGPHVVISTNVEDRTVEIWTTQMDPENIWIDDRVAIGKDFAEAVDMLLGANAQAVPNGEQAAPLT